MVSMLKQNTYIYNFQSRLFVIVPQNVNCLAVVPMNCLLFLNVWIVWPVQNIFQYFQTNSYMNE